ncbi:MAG TPA: XrtB/PEP-CTERM-associated transcriptional regulator EpsA [Burkholderiales bacterium]
MAGMESLALNLHASLRVHTRAQFFEWTQGLLQGLVRHDVLICALCSGEPISLRVDSFSLLAPDPGVFSESLLEDSPVAPNLIKAWEERRFRPVLCEAGSGTLFSPGAFSRKLESVGATRLCVHGTHDADARVNSLYIFACAPQTAGPRHADLVQVAVPFLHSAWVRTQIDAKAKPSDDPKSKAASNITPREQEILTWIYLGKSNIEIGVILCISPLTVKNHVQKILRKLNVVNRAQAIGKALELRILSPEHGRVSCARAPGQSRQ